MASGKGSYNGAAYWKVVYLNLEARRSAEPKKRKDRSGGALTGPQVAEHMSLEVRSLHEDASLREAGQSHAKMEGRLAPPHGQPVLRGIHHGFGSGVRSSRQWAESQHYTRQGLHAKTVNDP